MKNYFIIGTVIFFQVNVQALSYLNNWTRVSFPERQNMSPQNRLLANLEHLSALMKNDSATSVYDHKNIIDQTKEIRHHIRMNCYGFASYIIHKTHPEAFAEIYQSMQRMSPRIPLSCDDIPNPYHYIQALKTKRLKYWSLVHSLKSCQPGDILAYMPENFRLQKKPTFKGGALYGTHLMFANHYYGCADNFYHHFNIIDCTRRPHSRQYDSRWPDKKNAIGLSSIFIKPLATNKKVMIRWSFTSPYIHYKKLYILRLNAS
jgi:hypothetical protein